MPIPLAASIVVLVGAVALASMSALAEDAEGDKGRPKGPATAAEKQRAVEAATKASAESGKAKSGGERLGDRGSPKPDRSWDEMTPEEKDAARKRWLLNSGDFGPPGKEPPRSRPTSVPTTKDRKSAVERAEEAPAPEKSAPTK